MAMCPNGHQSGTDDWCEICGMRMPLPASGGEPRPSSTSASGYEPHSPSPASGYEPHSPSPASGYEPRPSAPAPGYELRPSAPDRSAPSPGSAPSSAFPASPSSAPPASAPPFPGFGGPGATGRSGGLPGDPTAAAEPCPQCGTPREGSELFCEECRYNFRTHSPTVVHGGFPPGPRAQHPPAPPPGLSAAPPPPAPGPGPRAGGPVPGAPLSGRPAPGGPLSGGRGPGGQVSGGGPATAPHAPEQPPYQRHESQRSRPSQVNRPAEPVPSESVTSGSGDFMLDPPSRPVPAGPQERQPGAAGSLFTRPPGPSGPASALPPPPAPRAAGPGGGPGPAGGGPQQGTQWVAVVGADRAYFAAMMSRSGPEAQGLYFPAFSPELRVPLSGHRITIGRRRHSTGEAPDIDLSRSPEDPGVSHQHAALVRRPDGGWSVVDQGSTNGTTVNLAQEPVQPYTPVPLGEGDRVHVGAWTTITVRRA